MNEFKVKIDKAIETLVKLGYSTAFEIVDRVICWAHIESLISDDYDFDYFEKCDYIEQHPIIKELLDKQHKNNRG